MTDIQLGTLDTLVQEKITGDTEFQTSLEGKSDDEKASMITEKTSQVREAEFVSLTGSNTENVELAKNYKIRAEKAEKKDPPAPTPGEEETVPVVEEEKLSTADTYALIDAKVPVEDLEEVQKAAKALGKTIPEALKDPILIGVLAKKVEHRKAADAANTGEPVPGVNQISDAQLVEDVASGKIVLEKGSPLAEQYFFAKRK